MNNRLRLRDYDLHIGDMATGPNNAITDVKGVSVGHSTVWFGEGELRPGEGPARTGVTAIIPHEGNVFENKLEAAAYVINGFGKSIGLAQLQELGLLESPILLTNTLSAPKVADALISYMLKQSPQIGISTGTVNVVVGECNDGYLNDIQGRHVQLEHVWQSLAGARSGLVEEGAIGAGTGMVTFGFKGGIGTSSRVLPMEQGGYTVGVLVLSNFGNRKQLMVGGVPVGASLLEYTEGRQEDGSIMVILATDAPLKSRQLLRLAKRVPFGLARVGSIASHGSGDFAIAFSTALSQPHLIDAETRFQQQPLAEDGKLMTSFFQATVESVEEAVLNSLFAAKSVCGRDNRLVPALPIENVLEICRKYGRLAKS